MANSILTKGVVTPFVIFNFVGGSIESNVNNPRYFMSLDHERSVKKACSFKLTIVYVPDTFKYGEPTLIDQLILSSKNQQVTYQYGYYDCYGVRHNQEQVYTGTVNTYTCDIDVASASLSYTVEGVGFVASLSNTIGSIQATAGPIRPSYQLKNLIERESGFKLLATYYDLNIQHTDAAIDIPAFESGPIMDLIMGTTKSSTNDNGIPTRSDGLVSLSNVKLACSIDEGYEKGLISQTEYDKYINDRSTINSAWDANLYNEYVDKLKDKIMIPYICYFDNTYSNPGKYGVLYYVPKDRTESDTNSVFEYDFGNNSKDSDVLSFSVSYNGASAYASAKSSERVLSSIDANGNPIGQSNAITSVESLGRNSFCTKSGFNENAFLSHKELSRLMLYPFEASMTIIGQLQPSELNDTIYVVVKLNGTPHPTLTGKYTITEIRDVVDSSGFTTELKLYKNVATDDPVDTEVYVTNPKDGKSEDVQNAINSVQ